tara:strand:+ start:4180 stop:5301 length:1122 start_codon:yes stop_codon:yes gene_type:complete
MGKRAARNQAAAMKEMNRMAQQQFDYHKAEQEAQKGIVAEQREQYEAFDFENPYGGIQNPYRGLQTEFENLASGARNVYAGMENPYEDLTVDMRAAEFQAQQGAQQRANILSGLRSAAGSSGVAGLAQALANQGTIQAQQISANIGQQERANQRLAAQGQMQIEQMERAGEADLQKMRIAGAQQAQALGISRQNMVAQGGFQAEQLRTQGDAMVQAAEFGRESSLMGMEYGLLAGANQALSGAMANQMSGMGMTANMYGQQAQQQAGMWAQGIGLAASIALAPVTTVAAGGATTTAPFISTWGSDRRLKKNINLIGQSPSGLNIYSFEYIDSKYGDGLFQGVISDEIPSNAVYSINGYDHVDYSVLDVEFKQI